MFLKGHQTSRKIKLRGETYLEPSQTSVMKLFGKKLYNDQKSKADIFCTLFSSVANNLKRKTIKLCNFTWKKLKSNPIRRTSKFNFRLVNKIWVENQLRLLKHSKATCPDNLLPGMLKDCSNELSGPLC